MKLPVIVINAYRRPESLKRLLQGLSLADIPQGVKLVFSLEFNPHADVVRQVETYDWPYGEKEVLHKEEKLGLIGHFLYCGGLTSRYGDMVYFEDDLFPGRYFYRYAQQVLEQYGHDEALAGFSLNALWFNGYLHTPFHPIDDGNDCFFLQVPWYQGQIYTPKQWSGFADWYERNVGMEDGLQIHEMFRNYKLSDDWFPIKTQYLIETGKYYCFPRVAHCVNFGDTGVHFQKQTNFFQTELAVGLGEMTLRPIEECLALYDSFYELLPDRLEQLAPHLRKYNVGLDLNATKDMAKMTNEYVITSVKPDKWEASFALEMRPPELNIVYQVEGNHFYLAKRKDVRKDIERDCRLAEKFDYHYRFKLSKKQRLKLFFGKLFRP